PEYQMTAPVWIRGILSDEYQVPVDSVTYLCGGEEEPGRSEKIPLSLPPQFQVRPIPPENTLAQMLEAGEIDALYAARAPSTFRPGAGTAGKVRRLFPDYQAVERDYYKRTGIFPIMHVVAINRDLYERNPWVAQSLYKAMFLAQQEAFRELHDTSSL